MILVYFNYKLCTELSTFSVDKVFITVVTEFCISVSLVTTLRLGIGCFRPGSGMASPQIKKIIVRNYF